MPVPSEGHYGFHSFPVVDWFYIDKTNIFDIFPDFLISMHFHYMKKHRLLSFLQRRNILNTFILSKFVCENGKITYPEGGTLDLIIIAFLRKCKCQ
jgi:hypothetical protein